MIKEGLETQSFNVSNFLQHQLDKDSLVVQTLKGIITIKDCKMISLLKSWEDNNTNVVSEFSLNKIFNEETGEAINFLKRYGILEELNKKRINISGITVISNETPINSLVFNSIKGKFGNKLNVRDITLNEFLLSQDSFCDELLIVILNPYDKKFINRFLKTSQDLTESVILTGYVYANNFYLDCFYSYEWKLPCHNCHIGHIKSSFYTEENEDYTYQQLIDMLYSETDDGFLVGTILDSVQELNIASLIVNKVNKYIQNLIKLEEFTKCSLLKLDTLQKYEDTSIHWEMCDCYE